MMADGCGIKDTHIICKLNNPFIRNNIETNLTHIKGGVSAHCNSSKKACEIVTLDYSTIAMRCPLKKLNFNILLSIIILYQTIY
jgi:hypothetical protein